MGHIRVIKGVFLANGYKRNNSLRQWHSDVIPIRMPPSELMARKNGFGEMHSHL